MRVASSQSENGPPLKTPIRRWRRYQPAANLDYDNDLDAETAPQTSSRSLPEPFRNGIELEFINTAHPHDATSSSAISSIRSHAARDIHASRRASASQSRGSERRRRMQVDTDGDSYLNVTWPMNIMIPVCNGFIHGLVRPITKLEQFLLNYC
jgi:hypothetical protein